MTLAVSVRVRARECVCVCVCERVRVAWPACLGSYSTAYDNGTISFAHRAVQARPNAAVFERGCLCAAVRVPVVRGRVRECVHECVRACGCVWPISARLCSRDKRWQ